LALLFSLFTYCYSTRAPPPTPDEALECDLKGLLLNTSMNRLPWFTDTARIFDALQLGKCVSYERPNSPIAVPPPSRWSSSASSLALYVSSSQGNDQHDGLSQETPLRTLEAARDASRSLRFSSGNVSLTIYMSGTFHLARPLLLNSALDSHTVWSGSGWPGTNPAIISGGIPLRDLIWEPSPLYPSPVLAATLPPEAPSSGTLFSLFDGGISPNRRLPAAREPNGNAETEMQPAGWALSRGGVGSLPFPVGSGEIRHMEVSHPVRNNSAFPGWGFDNDPRNPGVGYVWYGEGGGAAAWMAGNRTFWGNKTLPGGLLWNESGGLDPRSGFVASPFNASGWVASVQPYGRRRAHVFHEALWGNWV